MWPSRLREDAKRVEARLVPCLQGGILSHRRIYLWYRVRDGLTLVPDILICHFFLGLSDSLLIMIEFSQRNPRIETPWGALKNPLFLRANHLTTAGCLHNHLLDSRPWTTAIRRSDWPAPNGPARLGDCYFSPDFPIGHSSGRGIAGGTGARRGGKRLANLAISH